MQVHEKLKVIRLYRKWSQDEMAAKLGYSLNGYSKIERGETDIKVDKLGAIAKAIDVDLQQLLSLNDQNIFNVIESCNSHSHNYNSFSSGSILLSETQCAHELEKAYLLLDERNKEIENLKQQIAQLQEINALLKKQRTE